VRAVVGQALASATDTTTVIVVRAHGEDIEITCGGAAMVEAKSSAAAADKQPADSAFADGALLGKRYENAAGTVELLATKGGTSSLAIDGEILSIRAAKPLPASD
jgi:hypothetical protein